MKRLATAVSLVLTLTLSWALAVSASETVAKASPEQIIKMLQEGNGRYVAGNMQAPHRDPARVALAATENQGNYAYATVLSCSDSRVPVEILFDAGIMDIFVVRVAGNVAKTDEIGCIEYGLAHVNTPLLVVMGHTQCGAVNAVIDEVEGHGHALERNIPPLVAPIVPAVKRAQAANPDKKGKDLAPAAVRQNVWQSVGAVFTQSPAVRNMVKENKVKVVGAIYHMETGKVEFLPEEPVAKILAKVEASPNKPVNAMYEQAGQAAH
jgi:carbonic anhydrase